MPHRSDSSLEQRHDNYQKFFDNVPVALVRTDAKTGLILMANQKAADLLGYDGPDDLINKVRTTDLYPEEKRNAIVRSLKRAKKMESHEVRMALAEKTIWVSMNMVYVAETNVIDSAMFDITDLVTIREKHFGMLQDMGQKLDKRIAALTA